MAQNIDGTSANILDSILPKINHPRAKTPIWNETQHMFITDQYTSESGNTYYIGVRFSDRFVTLLHIGLYHNWTYINEVELYCFDGNQRVLIGKTSLDVFYNEDLVRSTVEKLLANYIESQYEMKGLRITPEELQQQASTLVKQSYLSMLNDPETPKRLEAVKPLILPKH